MTRIALLVVGVLMMAGCSHRNEVLEQARELTGGEPSRGVTAIGRYGCGSCHEIPGVRRATGTVGPPLAGVARRTYLAGHISNTPRDMVRWIQHPQQLEHGTAMPEMNISDTDAKDIVAYLYTLR